MYFPGFCNHPSAHHKNLSPHPVLCSCQHTDAPAAANSCILDGFSVLHPRGKQNQLDWIECFKPAAKKLTPAPEPQLASCKGDQTDKREEELHRSPSRQGRKRGKEQRWCFRGKICSDWQDTCIQRNIQALLRGSIYHDYPSLFDNSIQKNSSGDFVYLLKASVKQLQQVL